MTAIIPSREWDSRRRKITKLYIDKGYPLKVVRQKLANQGFEPTESQYRTRFKIWNIRKPTRKGQGLRGSPRAPIFVSPDSKRTADCIGSDAVGSDVGNTHNEAVCQIPPTIIPFKLAETKSTTNARTNLYSGNTEPRTNNYINPDHGFPSVHNHFWKSCVCNYTSQGDMVTVPSNTSASFEPSDDRFLYCPSWVEKSAKTCPNHLSVEPNRSPVGSHESQLADFALSEESLHLDGPDLPSSQSSVLDIEPCIDSNLTSEEFPFSWP